MPSNSQGAASSGQEREANASAWWSKHLEGAPEALDVPTDGTRTSKPSRDVRVEVLPLPPRVVLAVQGLAREASCPPETVVLAAYGALLGRLAGTEDVLVGAAIPSSRPGGGKGGRVLPVRLAVGGDTSFGQLVRATSADRIAAEEHGDVPSALRASAKFRHELRADAASGVAPADTGEEEHVELSLRVTADTLELVHSPALFLPARAQEMLAQLVLLLEQATASPAAPLRSHSLVTPAARKLLPDPSVEIDATYRGSIVDVFAKVVEASPSRVAVRDANTSFTYAELDACSNQLANRLVAAGCAKGDRVLVFADRNACLPLALLGVVKAGAAYVVMDPAYPPARLAAMIETADPRAVLRMEGVPPLDGAVEAALAAKGVTNEIVLPSVREQVVALLEGTSSSPPQVSLGPDDLVSLTFTSGSTGTPKAVAGRHGPVTFFTPILVRDWGFSGDDRFGVLSALAFNPVQREIFAALQLGATICVPSPDLMLDGDALVAWLEREGVTILHLVPALMDLLASATGGKKLPALRRVMVHGDGLPTREVPPFCELAPNVSVIVSFGSTELQRATSPHWAARDGVPNAHDTHAFTAVGRGLEGAQLLVVNEDRKLAGVGELGEMVFRSPHLSAGYFRNPEETRVRFVRDFLGSGPAYRMGDLGRYNVHGEVEFVGRRDTLVKIRGFRVELGDIEATLATAPGVGTAIVDLRDDGRGGKALVAYVLPAAGAQPVAADLKAHVGAALPDYMVPAAFVFIEKVPRSPNGKLDRRQLPAPDFTAAAGEYLAPRDEVEATVAAIFEDVLGLSRVGALDDFFALGGHSLRAVKAVSQIKTKLGVELPVRVLFEEATVELVAKRIRAGNDDSGPKPPPLVRTDVTSGGTTSLVQDLILHWEKRREPTTTWLTHLLFEMKGPVDAERLARAIRAMLERQEALRTAFDRTAPDFAPRLVPVSDVEVRITDVRGQAPPQIEARLAEISSVPFELKGEPLCRFEVFVADGRTLLSVRTHHLVHDPTEPGVLASEIMGLYMAEGGGPPPPELPVRYVDFAVWQRAFYEGEGKALIDAGQARVKNLQVMSIADKPEGSLLDTARHEATCELDLAATKKVSELFRGASLTNFMGMLAVFAGMIRHRTRANDLVILSPVSVRGAVGPEVGSLCGRFFNQVPVHVPLAGDPTWKELFAAARKATLDASAFQEVPIARVLGVDTPFDHPLGRLIVNVIEPYPVPTLTFGDIEVVLGNRPPKPGSRNDLVLFAMPRPKGLFFGLRASAARLERETVTTMIDQMAHALKTLDPSKKVAASFGG